MALSIPPLKLGLAFIPWALAANMDKFCLLFVAASVSPAEPAATMALYTVSYAIPASMIGVIKSGPWWSWSSRRVLWVHSLLQALGLSVVSASLQWSREWLSLLPLAIAISGLMTAPARARFQAMLQSAADGAFLKANTVVSGLTQLGFLLGPLFAGVLISSTSLPVALFIIAALYLTIPSNLILLKHAVSTGSKPSTSERGLGDAPHLGIDGTARRLLVATGLFFVLYAPLTLALPFRIADQTGKSLESATALIGAAWSVLGVGAILATFAFGRWVTSPKELWAYLIMCGYGVCALLIGTSPSMVIILASLFFGGIIYAPYTAIVLTVFGQLGQTQRFARANGLYVSVGQLSQPLGIALVGFLATWVSVSQQLLWASLALIGTGLAFTLIGWRKETS